MNKSSNMSTFKELIKLPSLKYVTPSKHTEYLIFIIVSVILCVTILLFFNSQRKKINKNIDEYRSNWSKYRCDPRVMPFAGMVTGKSSIGNMYQCADTYVTSKFMFLINPFISFFEQLIQVITDLVESVQNIRNMIGYMRSSIETALYDVADMFYNVALTFVKLIERLSQIMTIIYHMFEDSITSLKYTESVLHDIYDPLEGFFCFHKDTLVQTSSGLTAISNIKPGDIIKKGGQVIAIHIFSGKNTPMYNYYIPISNYKKTIVSGCHLVNENDKWVKVENSIFSQKISEKEDIIYCLTTEKGKILTNDIVFSDYMEIQNNNNVKSILNIVMANLNNTQLNVENNVEKETGRDTDNVNEKSWGFSKKTKIKMFDGTYKYIYNIKINDVLCNNNNVEGITKVLSSNIKLYEYSVNTCSGNTIVKRDEKWVLIKDVGKPVNKKEKYLYHLFTSNKNIIINDVEFKDYYQEKSESVNKKIDDFVISTLR